MRGDTPQSPQSQKIAFENPLTRTAQLYYHQKCTHTWSRIDGSGQLSSRGLARGSRNNTLTAITDKIKVIETIDDRVGSYYFSPTLILSGPRRKQCPLYSVKLRVVTFRLRGKRSPHA